ncbi:hypothetical protein AYI70_g1842 [Smittium culicis]|uniref:Uncharacterized protein n=1 Tax=Smittium culicis TaxID=133412 RepID=A0A1R1YAY5_9FUNG|nr:hypothetical protein AYI70_g1842 [Smittium culicis]
MYLLKKFIQQSVYTGKSLPSSQRDSVPKNAIVPLWKDGQDSYNSIPQQNPKIVYSEKVVGCRVSHSDISEKASSFSYNQYLKPEEQVQMPKVICDTGKGNLTIVMNFVFDNVNEIPMFIGEISRMNIECERRIRYKQHDSARNSERIRRESSIGYFKDEISFSQIENSQQTSAYNSQFGYNDISYSQPAKNSTINNIKSQNSQCDSQNYVSLLSNKDNFEIPRNSEFSFSQRALDQSQKIIFTESMKNNKNGFNDGFENASDKLNETIDNSFSDAKIKSMIISYLEDENFIKLAKRIESIIER